MVIVVTGATGFIGRAVLRNLVSRPFRTIGVLGRSQGVDSSMPVVEYWPADDHLPERIGQVTALERVTIINCAGAYTTGHSPEEAKLLVDSNIRFGVELVSSLAKGANHHFVNLGSYFQNIFYSNKVPHSIYAVTKKSFSDILKWFGATTNTLTTDLLLCDTYGPNDERPKLIPSLLKAAEDNAPIQIRNAGSDLNLCFVDDIARAVEGVVARRLAGEWSVRAPLNVSIREIVATVESIVGKKVVSEWRNAHTQEVVRLPEPPRLPAWEPQVSLRQGVSLIWNQDRNLAPPTPTSF